MPERSGRARAPDSPVPGESRVSRTPANASTRKYWPSAAKRSVAETNSPGQWSAPRGGLVGGGLLR
jgi:hypothetical protein